MVIHCTDVVKKHLPVIHFSWNYIAIGSSLKFEASRWQPVLKGQFTQKWKFDFIQHFLLFCVSLWHALHDNTTMH